MITFLEYNDWSDVVMYVLHKKKLDITNFLKTGNPPFNILTIDSIHDVFIAFQRQKGDLFNDEDSIQAIIIDVQNIPINKDIVTIMQFNNNQDYILVNRQKSSLLASEKKLISSYCNVEKVPQYNATFVQKTLMGNFPDVPEFFSAWVAKQSSTWDEVITYIYFWQLGLDLYTVQQAYDSTHTPELYQLSLTIPSHVSTWYKLVQEDTVQYMMSMLMTKSAKLEDNGEIARLIIYADELMKSAQTAKPVIIIKELLWRILVILQNEKAF